LFHKPPRDHSFGRLSNLACQIASRKSRTLGLTGKRTFMDEPPEAWLGRSTPNFSTEACHQTVPDFQNPTGVTMSLARRKRLVEIANAHELIILEDSPYREIRLEGERIPPIKIGLRRRRSAKCRHWINAGKRPPAPAAPCYVGQISS
jgi:hypothetical protein